METNLKRILREEGRRQSWLADKIGINQHRMSNIVNGLHCPNDLADRIADALGRSRDEVFQSREPVA